MGKNCLLYTKGFLLQSIVDYIEKNHGTDNLSKIQEKYGEPLNFKSTQNIPLEKSLKFIKAVLNTLWSKSNPEKETELGKLIFNAVLPNPLIQNILSILGQRDIKKVILSSKKYHEVFDPEVDVKSEMLEDKKIWFTRINDTDPINVTKGVILAYIEYAGHKGSIEAQSLKPGINEFIISWR